MTISVPPDPPAEAAHAGESQARRSWWRATLRAVEVRFRLIVVLLGAFLVVGQWDALRNRFDSLVRAAKRAPADPGAVSADTEYFCPMDPGVISDWPSKCPICNMGLVRRKRGETAPLPDGVLSRMQFSPYRLHLAGIRADPVAYQALNYEVEAIGTASARETGSPLAVIDADLFDKDRRFVTEGLAAEITCETLPHRPAFQGTVREVRSVERAGRPRLVARIVARDPEREIVPGMAVVVRVRMPIDRIEPFRSLPADPPAIRTGEPRAVFACPDHPDLLLDQPGRCAIDRNPLERRTLEADQRLGWWCPMHPRVTAERAGAACSECGGMTLQPRILSFRPPGEVLAVPESAVVDNGTRTMVYVERMPGMFDGVEVVLGPRCGAFYPVVRGLERGQRVATSGAFLLDGETRLNPSIAAAYFGSNRGASAGSAVREPVETSVASSRAGSGTCPVTGKRLGSMGDPVKVVVAGQAVWLCCDGCEDRLRKDPAKYLKAAQAPKSSGR